VLASASGSCESNAPDSSAWYSRERDTAIWMIAAAMGARSQAKSSPNSPNGLPLRSSPPPKNSAKRARNVMLIPMPAATEEIRMSRLATREISWARTPRSSRSSKSCRMPRVTETAACSGFRPVANALGCCISET
jgi:hypothetical protein